jgi:hypothetical protein
VNAVNGMISAELPAEGKVNPVVPHEHETGRK